MKPNRLLLIDNTNYTHMFSFTPGFKIHCCHLVPGSAVIGSHYAKQFGYCWLLVNKHKPSQVKLTARGRNVGPGETFLWSSWTDFIYTCLRADHRVKQTASKRVNADPITFWSKCLLRAVARCGHRQYSSSRWAMCPQTACFKSGTFVYWCLI